MNYDVCANFGAQVIFFSLPPTVLSTETHYENMMHLFNEKGYFCNTIDNIQNAIQKSMKKKDKPSIINVMINPSADRKPQTFSWLTESKL